MKKLHNLMAISFVALLVGCSQAPVPVTSMQKPVPPPPPAYVSYVVERGDTLSGVASQYQMSYRALAKLNNIGAPYRIHVGQILQVPNPRLLADQVATEKQAYGGEIAPIKVENAIPAKALNLSQYSDNSSASSAATTVPAPKAQAVAASTGVSVSPGKQATVDQVTWSWPVKGQVVQEFGQGSGLFAKGMQIQTVANAQVLAAADGTVIFSGTGADGYGKMLIIKSNNNFLTAYTNLSSFSVQQGQTVQRGNPIAVVGTLNGQSMVHFEVRKFGSPVDPSQYLPS